MTDFEVTPINKLKDLEQKLEKCKEVLRFYGDQDNYSIVPEEVTYDEVVAGDKARTLLKELEE